MLLAVVWQDSVTNKMHELTPMVSPVLGVCRYLVQFKGQKLRLKGRGGN